MTTVINLRCPPPPTLSELALINPISQKLHFFLIGASERLSCKSHNFYISEHDFVRRIQGAMSCEAKKGFPLPLSRLLARPDTGKIYQSLLQNKIDDSTQSVESRAEAVVSLLLGQDTKLRSGSCFSADDGKGICVQYPEAEYASKTFSRIDLNIKKGSEDSNVLRSFYSYAELLLSHPFPDGNGRFSRYLLQCGLSEYFSKPGIFLHLAPVMYANPGMLIHASRNLSHSGNWMEFSLVIASVIYKAVVLVERAYAED